MRIIHVITRLIVGGAQENTIASVLGLRRKPGLEVSLISGPTTGPEGSLENQVAHEPGLLTIVPELIRPISPIHDFMAVRRLASMFRERKPDLVHTHSGKAGFLGRLAAFHSGVPIIVHSIHGPSFGDFQRGLANGIFRAAERYAGRLTTHFIVVAQAMADEYLAAGIGKAGQYTRIWSGFALEPFLTARNDPDLRKRLGLSHTDFVVGKIARLFKLKGHDDLIGVAPELVRANPRIKFLLVGDGLLREKFESQVRALNLQDHFIFTGLVSPDAVPGLIGIMDALVHLSRREGLPRALPQAMAAAKPVLAFDCAGAREVCINDRTGYLLRPGDRATLKERLLTLSAQPALCQRLGESGRALVRREFGLQKMIDDQHALYERLASRLR